MFNARSIFSKKLYQDSVKGLIKDYENGEYLEFIINPDNISDNKSNSFAVLSTPGTSNPLIQWSSGGKRTVSFKLKLYRTQDNNEIQQKVRWLQSLQYPEYGSDGRVILGPHRVLFIFGDTYASDKKWIVESVKVQYGNLWSRELVPYGAEVDITLMEWNEEPISYQSFRR